MKFKSAYIQNFKLLRDVTVEFSTEADRPVTVIRAENGSGKTSTLYALQWGLFGEAGLEESARRVRLSPSDWPDGARCDIKVQIDFVHTVYDEVGGEFFPSQTNYRIVRTVVETPQGDRFLREAEKVYLFELTDAGSEQVRGPEIKIGEMLPSEMKDVFFTDGDRAMNFISPQLTKRTKQHQVREAIRSLLGLTVLESALEHIKKSNSKFNTQLAEATGSVEAATIHRQLEEKRTELEALRSRVESLEKQLEQIAKLEDEADRKLLQAMKGVEDHAELAKKLETARQQLGEAENVELRLKKRHQSILGSESLSWALLGPKLAEGLDVLSGLADKGVIPAASLPVLQDRLDLRRCICDGDLSEGTTARAKVVALLETQRKVDEEKKVLTELFHRGKAAVEEHRAGGRSDRGWLSEYDDLANVRLANKKRLESLRNEIGAIEAKVALIDQSVIEDLKTQRDAYRADKSRKEQERQDAEVDRRRCEDVVQDLERKWDQIKAAAKKQRTIQNRITVSQDLATAIGSTLQEIQTVYLRQVSERMNDLFLQMVGADPKVAGGVFKRAEITPDYEIKVLTADSRTLDPDHELNGASKRALTIAFIWALTEVSGVIAPRVIDTPLGMMSGGVKRRVVEIISSPDSSPPVEVPADEQAKAHRELQVVLFLTRQEILKVEDLLDQRAGKVVTITNTAGYPVDLVNDPRAERPTILVCSCNHRQKCHVCARKDDDQYELDLRPHAS